ncbi:MAG: hypothetical protein AAF950_16935 [Pseudomonadota bacterium]
MPDQLEQNALDLLAELDALSDRTGDLIRELSLELSGLDATVESYGSVLDNVADQAREASATLANILGDGVTEKLDQARVPLDAAMEAITQLETQIAQKINGEGGLLKTCDEATLTIQSAEDTATELLVEGTERADGAFDAFQAQLETMSSALDSAIDTLESELETQADEAAAQVADNIVTPLREAAEAIQVTWDRLFKEQVTEVLETLFTDVNAEIQAPLDEAVNQMAGLLEEELQKLVQELKTGDAEGDAVRAGLDEALDALEGAIAPMEAALDAFRGLASSVGVDI